MAVLPQLPFPDRAIVSLLLRPYGYPPFMTSHLFRIGFLTGVLALAPLLVSSANAQYDDEFNDNYYEDLYRDIDAFNEPYGSANSWSTYYGSQYDDYYDYDNVHYTTPDYRYPTNSYSTSHRTNYRQNYT